MHLQCTAGHRPIQRACMLHDGDRKRPVAVGPQKGSAMQMFVRCVSCILYPDRTIYALDSLHKEVTTLSEATINDAFFQVNVGHMVQDMVSN